MNYRPGPRIEVRALIGPIMHGIELKARREALAISQSQLAAILRTSQVVVSRWETGERAPRDPDSIRLIIEALEEAQTDLIGELYAIADDEERLVESPALTFTAYTDEAAYLSKEPRWARCLPLNTHRATIGRIAALLELETGRDVRITNGD